jgi:hypothetical protein
VIIVGPKWSLTGCTTFSNSAFAASRCSSVGVLSMPLRDAV